MTDIDLTVVLPCLNEEETLGVCLDEIHEVLDPEGITYEILVADNGSSDRSVAIAGEKDARVVHVKKRGYGNAYLGGIPEAKGRLIFMADSDMSYDFHEIPNLYRTLVENDYDLVLGSRLKGKMEPGAMPWLHRRVGTPILTFLLNRMFHLRISDSQSGMRLFTREAWKRMDLSSPGMEFASEMLVKAARLGLSIGETPVHFRRDRRDRPPHLRSFRDGWRHLRFLFLFSPSTLFLVPAGLLICLGIVAFLISLYGLHLFGRTYSFHMSIAGMLFLIIGTQILFFGLFARLNPLAARAVGDRTIAWFERSFRLEPWIVFFGFILLVGLIGDVILLARWIHAGMGVISPHLSVLIVTFVTLSVMGLQGFFGSLYLSILHIQKYGLQ